MIHRNLQIAIIFLILVFTGSNILPDVLSTSVAVDVNQPVQESQDNEKPEKLSDEQELMNRSLILHIHFPVNTDAIGRIVVFSLDHTLEVNSPPPKTFLA
jgi:hypothetical protein